MADFTAALIRRDMGAALGLLAENAVLFYSNGTTIRGRAAFSAVMAANWELMEDYRYATLDPTWLAQSDAAAAVIYGFEWSGRVRGWAASGSGRATRVFCRSPAGWLIAHEHLSAGEWKS
jgi:ketosteroid isomerase-like protein